jgi:hypothetical protein
MKPTLPPRLPEAIESTSLHGAPVRSMLRTDPVSRADHQRRSHGAPAPRSSRFTRFPERCISPLHRVPVRRIRFSARFPGGIDAFSRTGRPYESSSLRCSGCPKQRRLLHRTGCSSSWRRHSTPGYPDVYHRLQCARSEHENSVFARFPARSHHPRCTAAHAGGTRSARLPTRNVSSARSHLHVERVAVRRSHRTVAHAMRRRER